MIHEVLPVGMLQCNCSILGDEASGEAIVVDPGDEIPRILAVWRKHKLTVKQIIDHPCAHRPHRGCGAAEAAYRRADPLQPARPAAGEDDGHAGRLARGGDAGGCAAGRHA